MLILKTVISSNMFDNLGDDLQYKALLSRNYLFFSLTSFSFF